MPQRTGGTGLCLFAGRQPLPQGQLLLHPVQYGRSGVYHSVFGHLTRFYRHPTVPLVRHLQLYLHLRTCCLHGIESADSPRRFSGCQGCIVLWVQLGPSHFCIFSRHNPRLLVRSIHRPIFHLLGLQLHQQHSPIQSNEVTHDALGRKDSESRIIVDSAASQTTLRRARRHHCRQY